MKMLLSIHILPCNNWVPMVYSMLHSPVCIVLENCNLQHWRILARCEIRHSRALHAMWMLPAWQMFQFWALQKKRNIHTVWKNPLLRMLMAVWIVVIGIAHWAKICMARRGLYFVFADKIPMNGIETKIIVQIGAASCGVLLVPQCAVVFSWLTCAVTIFYIYLNSNITLLANIMLLFQVLKNSAGCTMRIKKPLGKVLHCFCISSKCATMQYELVVLVLEYSK